MRLAFRSTAVRLEAAALAAVILVATVDPPPIESGRFVCVWKAETKQHTAIGVIQNVGLVIDAHGVSRPSGKRYTLCHGTLAAYQKEYLLNAFEKIQLRK